MKSPIRAIAWYASDWIAIVKGLAVALMAFLLLLGEGSKLNYRASLICGILASMMFVGTSQADSIVDGVYWLHDSPAGGAQPPLYGLRLDGLGGGSSIYTFNFDYSDADRTAAMFLGLQTEGDGNRTMRIFGDLYGGLNTGPGYDDPTGGKVGWWTVDFTYRENGRNSGDGGNFDDILAGPDPSADSNTQTQNNGTLNWNDPNNASTIGDDGDFVLVEYPLT